MTQHNLWFYRRMLQGLRGAIAAQALNSFASEFLGRYRSSSLSRSDGEVAAEG
jgi:queuine/archaeosine tRNA-ribosyltransferase